MQPKLVKGSPLLYPSHGAIKILLITALPMYVNESLATRHQTMAHSVAR